MTVVVRWLFGTILAIVAVLLSVANRQDVLFTWSPVHEALEIPLYALFLGFAFAGFLFGALIAWLSGAEMRKERRRQKKLIRALETDIDDLRAELVNFDPSYDDETEGLPSRLRFKKLLPGSGSS